MRPEERPLSPSLLSLRSDALAIAGAAIAAVDADACVRRALWRLIPGGFPGRRWHVLAAGKAAGPMLRAALDEIPGIPASAVCVAPHAVPGLPAFVDMCVGGHPVPNEGSVAAGTRALSLASACRPDEELLVLLSGGASALLAAPPGDVSLADKQATTQQLLRSGADIHAINTVRKHLSLTKGGRLAAAAAATTTCLVISDVVGDDLSVIASGPTVADATTFGDALAVLDRYGGRLAYPPRILAWLQNGAQSGRYESPKPASPALARARTFVVASRPDALRGAEAEAARRGYAVAVLDEPVTGEARDAAQAHAGRVGAVAAACPAALCVLSAGETTVTVTGGGVGGRNQEFALASVEWLSRLGREAVLVSVGTDGIDGPTNAAGAVADSTSLARSSAADLGAPGLFLTDNDAYHYFAALGDLVTTGATGTNVGDVQVAVLGEKR